MHAAGGSDRLAWAALLRPHRGAIAALLGLSLASSALVLVQPWLTKQLIDEGLIARDFGRIVASAGLIFLAGLAGSVLGGINRYHYTRVSARILFALRERMFGHLLKLSPAWFARQRGGDLLARLDGDVAEIQRFAVDGLFAGVSGVFGLVGTLALMLALSPSLTLLALLLLPVQWFYLRHMRPRVQERVRGVRERAADISAFLVEKLPAVKLLQGLATGAGEALRLRRLNRAYLDGLLNLQIVEFATAAVPATLTSAVRAAVFIAGGWLVVQGRMGVGALIAFSTYLGMATGPVQSLLGVYMGLGRVRVSIERVELLSAAEPDVVDAGRRPPPERADIRLDDIGFRYPAATTEAGEWVFRHVSLTLPAGAKIGVWGPSGAGKTSFADLLLRHYDPAEGSVLLGAHALPEYSLDDWRRRVALIAQETVLFRGSLADNIRYAAPEADDAAVLAAARAAGLGALLERLPEGLDTAVGDRGTRLSGGERQRVAIARALLGAPLLVICDEATSAVDAEAEAWILDSIDMLFAHATRIVISHRDAPLRDVDLLLHVDAGGIRVDAGGRA